MNSKPTNHRASRDFENAAIDGVSAIPGMRPVGAGLKLVQAGNDWLTGQYEEALRTVRNPHASADEKRKAAAIIQRTEHRHDRA